MMSDELRASLLSVRRSAPRVHRFTSARRGQCRRVGRKCHQAWVKSSKRCKGRVKAAARGGTRGRVTLYVMRRKYGRRPALKAELDVEASSVLQTSHTSRRPRGGGRAAAHN